MTLLVGAMVVNALPNRTARAADLATAAPLRTLVFGLATLFLSIGTALVLLVVPLVNLFAILAAGLFVLVTSTFGATVVGRFLGGTTRGQCLAIGAAVAAGLAVVPIGGGLAQLAVNAVGAGALFREARATRAERDDTAEPGRNPL